MSNGVRQTIYLQDKMSNTLSKIQQNALRNIQTFNKMSKEVDGVKKALEEAEKINPEIVKSEMYAQASQALEDMEGKLYDVAKGNVEVKETQDEASMSATELNQSLEVLSKGWQLVSKAVQEAHQWMDMFNKQFNSEFKSGLKMSNILGASSEDIGSMYDYAAALQKVGVVGDEATISGMASLSMYVDSLDQVKQLTPAILDLAVAQNGLETSQSNVESTAMMVGRALNGNAMLLKRQLGLTEDQVKHLDELNDKNEKAAYLYELMSNKVGGANELLASTAQGGMMQANNALGDMQEKLGQQVLPYFAAFEQMLVQILQPIVEFATANSDWLIPSIIALIAGLGVLIAVLTVLKVVNFLVAASELAVLWPLLILIAMIAAFVAAINIAAQALSDWSGTTVSAMGLVFGALNVMITALQNVFIDLYNGCQLVINGIMQLFISLGQLVIGIINEIAQAIDAVFGSNLSGYTQNLLSQLSAAKQAIEEDPGFAERKSYTDAYKSGYDYGANMFKGKDGKSPFASLQNTEDLFKGVNNIDKNLGGLTTNAKGGGGKALKTTSDDKLLTDEDIQLLLDVATRDYQLNYQQMTPNITLGDMYVRETADVDAVMDRLGERIDEVINGDAEVKNYG